MRKWLFIVLLILIVAGGAFLFFGEGHLDEPVYQGKPLSEWLDKYIIVHGSPDGEAYIAKNNGEVDEVVLKIGTNAIPTLFRMLGKRDSVFRNLAVWSREKGIHDFKLKSVPAMAQNIQAAMAFDALGPAARDAVPRLLEMYKRTRSEPHNDLIVSALGGIGPAASNVVPFLLQTVTNPEPHYLPDNSFRALGQIHAYPEQVVPLMIKFLKDGLQQ